MTNTHRNDLSKIEVESLRGMLDYEKETGVFRWKKHTSNSCRKKVGSVAGGADGHGYTRIKILGTMYMAHRLAWLYETGLPPEFEIDHINGDRSDNRFCNLRDVSKSINSQNTHAARRDNSTGMLGVYKRSSHKKFYSAIRVEGKLLSLGYFDSKELAHDAYLSAKRKLHAGCTI